MSGGPGGQRGHGAIPGPGEEWDTLAARALDPDIIGARLAEVILEFGCLVLAGLLKDPAAAPDRHPGTPAAFARECRRRGIPADTVTAFLFARRQPRPGAILCGHTAVQVGALGANHPGGSREIIIDWTARRFHPGVPVPLVLAAADWRAFWLGLADRMQRGDAPVLPPPVPAAGQNTPGQRRGQPPA
jgi:hypothetical protein